MSFNVKIIPIGTNCAIEGIYGTGYWEHPPPKLCPPLLHIMPPTLHLVGLSWLKQNLVELIC